MEFLLCDGTGCSHDDACRGQIGQIYHGTQCGGGGEFSLLF